MSSGDSDEAQPGLAPGSSGPEGIMFAALYGELSPHPWRSSVTADEDAYSLFHKRSLAMGWLTDTGKIATFTTDPRAGQHMLRNVADTGAKGLWSMHEAESELPGRGSSSAPVAWFQVGIDAVPAERPLPVQPFLCCIDDVLRRLGTLRPRAVQVLLPLQQLATSARLGPLYPPLSTTGWFSERDPALRTPVRVTLDSGQNPAIAPAAPRMFAELQRPELDAFTCDGYSLTDHGPLLPPPFDDSFWNGPPQHRVTFHGTLAEWSLDALGWLAAFLAGAGAQFGVTTPVVLTAVRA